MSEKSAMHRLGMAALGAIAAASLVATAAAETHADNSSPASLAQLDDKALLAELAAAEKLPDRDGCRRSAYYGEMVRRRPQMQPSSVGLFLTGTCAVAERRLRDALESLSRAEKLFLAAREPALLPRIDELEHRADFVNLGIPILGRM